MINLELRKKVSWVMNRKTIVGFYRTLKLFIKWEFRVHKVGLSYTIILVLLMGVPLVVDEL
jgi:hypothetical protein